MAANVGGKSVVGGGAGVGGTAGGGTAACRASGSRWTPTPEQIRILKELYYGCGIRSPNSEQIQRITAMLRQHGKIEGKNVFYWFQNHKARERQKRRLTILDVNVPAATADAGYHGALSLSSPSGAPPPSSPLGLYAGNGGGSALQLDTSSDWGTTTTTMANETCFLQDYMGVMRGTGGGHHGSSTGAAAPSPWACFSSPDSWAAAAPTTTTTTRAPETLPLFPTGDGDNVQPPPPRHGAPAGDAIRGVGSGYLPTLPFWGAAATAPTATTTTSVTIQQQHHPLLQLQDQYSFYTTNSQPPSSHDASSAATASLELSLSSWCSPYPAGTM